MAVFVNRHSPRRRHKNGVLLALLASLCVPAFVSAQAPDESHDEAVGAPREGRAWGGTGENNSSGSAGVRRYARVLGLLGAGGTLRLIEYQNLTQTRFAPGFLQLRGAFFFEGEGDIQHGAGLGISANLTGDGSRLSGIDPFAQWTLSPSYFLRYWLDDSWQVMGSVGVPIALSSSFTTIGGEINAYLMWKPFAGLGLYASIGYAMFFANDVHPMLSADGGFVIDYEVLP